MEDNQESLLEREARAKATLQAFKETAITVVPMVTRQQIATNHAKVVDNTWWISMPIRHPIM